MPRTDDHASMADVARSAGVSVSTVSRALRGSPLVSAGTTDRVVAAAEELSFAISRAASGLASGRLGRIGVLVGGSLQGWFNGTVLEAIYAELAQADTELTIFRIMSLAERNHFFTLLPARRNVDAMMIASFVLTAPERQRLRALRMPVVYMNQRVRGVPSVAIDDATGSRDGVRALLGLGHQRIAFVQTANWTGFRYSATDRIDGFRAAMAEAGVASEDQIVITAPGPDAAEPVVAAWLALSDRPTALAIDSDELAIGALSALNRSGVRVPDDVSVLGFDGHAFAERLGLSTVEQPADRIGSEAATMAMRLAAGQPLRRRTVVVPTRVVLRDTTGPGPAGRAA